MNDGYVWLHADGRVTANTDGRDAVAATYQLDFCREKQRPTCRYEVCEALLTYEGGGQRRCEVRMLNLRYGENGRARCKPQRVGFGAALRWGAIEVAS